MILVANLGSTSFKYRLFDMETENQLARGGIERIGSSESHCVVEIGDIRKELSDHIPNHAAAVRMALRQLTDDPDGCLSDVGQVAGIGFKAVHGGRISGVQRITSDVLAAMEEMNEIAPAHNPPYINAMRLLAEKLPEIPLVAAFETAFHATISERSRRYAIPQEWSDQFHVQKWGFHGASHRFIAERSTELFGGRDDLRIISCHLGGSSSLCAIRNGKSVATSMGMSPQSGLPQNNRVGDFDPFALPLIMRQTGQSLSEVLHTLANHGGLLGMSGVSGDIRDVEESAASGNSAAQLALDVYVSDIRRYLGGLLVELGGADVIAFTGGIGEKDPLVRDAVCANLASLGIAIDPESNRTAKGECEISAPSSQTRVWVIPTNEEIIVARQTYQSLTG